MERSISDRTKSVNEQRSHQLVYCLAPASTVSLLEWIIFPLNSKTLDTRYHFVQKATIFDSYFRRYSNVIWCVDDADRLDMLRRRSSSAENLRWFRRQAKSPHNRPSPILSFINTQVGLACICMPFREMKIIYMWIAFKGVYGFLLSDHIPGGSGWWYMAVSNEFHRRLRAVSYVHGKSGKRRPLFCHFYLSCLPMV